MRIRRGTEGEVGGRAMVILTDTVTEAVMLEVKDKAREQAVRQHDAGETRKAVPKTGFVCGGSRWSGFSARFSQRCQA